MMLGTLSLAWGAQLASLSLLAPADAFSSAHACGLEPPHAQSTRPLEQKPNPAPTGASARPFVMRGEPQADRPAGILSGKTVYVSAGHGWVRTDFGWRTQRGNTNDIVEDFVSIEAVNEYLIPTLHGMGAYVVPVREPDVGSPRVIVDDVDATLEGSATEGAAAGTGWGTVTLPITSDATRPFDTGDARSLVTTAEGGGELRYALSPPEDNTYNVYVSYVQGPDRAPDAHWVVRHSGGETSFRLDQRRHGSTWVLLGRFHFEAGAPVSQASVALLDDSETPGALVSADAVRIGGGEAVHDRGDGPHPGPLSDQAARYYTQFSGAPDSVFNAGGSDQSDDVSSRSRFTAWEHEDGEDAVYVAWHTNAPNPGRGTDTYTYSSSAPNGSLGAFSGVAGSRELQDALHAQLIEDLRAEVDPEWPDRGRHTAYFGEVNPNNNPETPAVLIEVGFHSTPTDADFLRAPHTRRVATRAIAQGIAQYFAQADGVPLVLPPEPPTALWVQNIGEGALEIGWDAPVQPEHAGDAPSGYLVQTSPNGYGFDEGVAVDGTSATLEGYAAGELVFVRVVAFNEGGHSLPSSVVGAGVAPSGNASVLVVDGFDRLDSGLLLDQDNSAWDIGVVDRMQLRKMNDFSYVARHGAAIGAAGYSFDSATDEAIERGTASMLGYQAVDWYAGTDSSLSGPFPLEARTAVASYVGEGGRLLVSGSELGWALDNLGEADEQAFYREVLRAVYVADDAQTGEASLDGVLGPLGPLSFEDPSTYTPRFPDVLEPARGAEAAMLYADGLDSVAAVSWDDGDARGVTMGFPFETIDDAATRADVMAAVLGFFDVVEEDGPDTGGTGGVDTDGGVGDSSGDDGGTALSGDGGGTGDGDTEGRDSDALPGADGADDGCGCRHGGGGGASLVLLLGLLGLRRRE
ncbi:MAG: N-acetylmuramoyl-L-alanine amidase [Nannocystaceae bacterium]|nr:N-acetylmuramoyl-L-alanine amidase [bacterium]